MSRKTKAERLAEYERFENSKPVIIRRLRDGATLNQIYDWIAEKHPEDNLRTGLGDFSTGAKAMLESILPGRVRAEMLALLDATRAEVGDVMLEELRRLTDDVKKSVGRKR